MAGGERTVRTERFVLAAEQLVRPEESFGLGARIPGSQFPDQPGPHWESPVKLLPPTHSTALFQ